MTVPREALRLRGDPDAPRLVTRDGGLDRTEMMLRWARRRADALGAPGLDGFVFKSRSPSCGVRRVAVYDREGRSHRRGTGLFARLFQERFPLLPVEDEGHLNDPGRRENFLERLFTMRRWRETVARGRRRGVLAAFHAREEWLLRAHSPALYREMGRLAAAAARLPAVERFDRYARLLMQALGRRATPARNANVLRRAIGSLGKRLDPDEKREVTESVERYVRGRVPLIVPVTLLNHYARRYDQMVLRRQTYLNPHPVELRLRNHA